MSASTSELKSLKIGVRPGTRAKFDAIAVSKRWTLTETADALADEYIQQHGISVPAAEAKAHRSSPDHNTMPATDLAAG